MTPSILQRIVASGWLLVIWQWTWAIVMVWHTIGYLEFNSSSLLDPWSMLLGLASVLIALGIGWVAAIPASCFFLVPILHLFGIRNGGPFTPGDRVQILRGPNRGSVTDVYQNWQHETVRVNLGEQAKADYKDIFSAYELLRECADGKSDEPVSQSQGFQ